MYSLAFLVVAGAAFGAGFVVGFSESSAYITALEDVLSECVGDYEGQLWIDDELHLCGIARTGIKR